MTGCEVSAIIIFLNGGVLLEEAIQSVFAQTFTDWELLLVDDGSTDESTAVARRFAAAHPDRVKYLEHPNHENRGMSASRNLGMREAAGKYIAFVDADDVWLPHKLAEQIPLMESHPEVAMMYGRTEIWFGWTGRAEDAERDYLTETGFSGKTVVEPPALLKIFLASERYLPCTCSVIVRRDVAVEVGGFVDEFRTMYEDMVFYAKIFSTRPVLVANGCWDRYRQHDKSSCGQALASGELDYAGPNRARERYLEWVDAHLRDRPVDSELRRILDQQLWPYRHPRAQALLTLVREGPGRAKSALRRTISRCLPAPVKQRIRDQWRRNSPAA